MSYTSLFTGSPKDVPLTPAAGKFPIYRILLVDDEINVSNALKRVFRQDNYEITTSPNAIDALEKLCNLTFHLMITDYKMPGMSGAELLREAKKIRPEIIRIMLTGHADTGAVMGAIKDGALYKFILKPWNDDDLRVTVALALAQHELLQKNRLLQQENSLKAKQINALSKLAVSNGSRLALMLNKRKLLTDQQAQELQCLQQERREPVIKLLLERDWVKEKTIQDILRQELMVEEVALTEFYVDPAVAALFPHGFCSRQWVVPLKLSGRRLMMALADPLDTELIENLRFASGLDIQPVMASSEAIKEKITEVYGGGGDEDFFSEQPPAFRIPTQQ